MAWYGNYGGKTVGRILHYIDHYCGHISNHVIVSGDTVMLHGKHFARVTWHKHGKFFVYPEFEFAEEFVHFKAAQDRKMDEILPKELLKEAERIIEESSRLLKRASMCNCDRDGFQHMTLKSDAKKMLEKLDMSNN